MSVSANDDDAAAIVWVVVRFAAALPVVLGAAIVPSEAVARRILCRSTSCLTVPRDASLERSSKR